MSVSTCPSCHESVTVPVEAQPDSVVRCPLCQEEFRLRDFLAQLPPALIVLSPTGHETTGHAAFDSSESADATSFPQMSEAVADAHVPAFDFAPGSASGEDASAVDTSYVQPRRQKNPTVEMAKIVAGGLLALPLAQLILWWLPGKWQRDPLQIGPDVGRVVPWIVPANFRPGAEDLISTAAREPDSTATSRARPRKGVVPPPANPERSRGRQTADAAGSAAGQEKVQGTKTPKNRLRDEQQNGEQPSEPPQAASDRVVLGVKNAPTYSAEQMRKVLEEAIQANVAWDFSADVTDEAMAAAQEHFYTTFAQLGHAVTFTDTSSGDVRSYVQTLLNMLSAFGEQPKKLAMIGNRGALWLQQQERPNGGAFLFGTVKQIRYRGLLYETTVDLAARSDDRTVTVVSTRDPKTAFPLQSRVLILGAVVNDPSLNMVGYQGDDSQVVVAGFPVPLPE